LREALRLWRGPLLADEASDLLRSRLGAPWTELRLTALEMVIEAELAQEHHRDVVGELTTLIADNPFRERLTGLLMLALYRSGRQAEALEAFGQLDARLRGELGLDPVPELRELQRRILAADPDLLAGTANRGAAVSRAPQQLPADTRAFTGRTAELDRLLGLMDGAAATAAHPAVTICAIDGMAGVGKTALALHTAHRIAARFPDGQLFVDLRGYSSHHPPRSPADVLDGFLRALGVPSHRNPQDVEERAAAYRERLAGTRTLIVLDNAASGEQIRPLIPGAAGCLVVVTSRRRLKSLDDAHTLTLDTLPEPDAVALFRAVAGSEQAPENDPQVGSIAAFCGYLPLALRIAAALLRARHAWTPGDLAGLLSDERRRIDLFQDDERDLTSLLDLSYRALVPEQQRMLALLGLAPGAGLGVSAVASLVDTDPVTAQRLLAGLVDDNLLGEPAPGRFELHDLVCLYAAERARRDLTPDERDAALRRFVDFFLHSAHASDRLMDTHRAQVQLDRPAPGCSPESPADNVGAVAWFHAERANLRAAQQLAAEQGWHDAVWQIAWTATAFHHQAGHLQENLEEWQLGLSAAERLGDRVVQSVAHRLFGRACAYLGRADESVEHLHRSLAFARLSADLSAQAHAHYALMLAWSQRGDDEKALEHGASAMELYDLIDDADPTWKADTLNSVGWLQAKEHRYDVAHTSCEAALALYRHYGHRNGESSALDSLGFIAHQAGEYSAALGYYHEAVALRRELGYAYGEANVLEHLGQTHAALGDAGRARWAWQRALALYQTQQRSGDADRIRGRLYDLERRTTDSQAVGMTCGTGTSRRRSR
jgi:tetratricopeptide (TPR) repeat protein